MSDLRGVLIGGFLFLGGCMLVSSQRVFLALITDSYTLGGCLMLIGGVLLAIELFRFFGGGTKGLSK